MLTCFKSESTKSRKIIVIVISLRVPWKARPSIHPGGNYKQLVMVRQSMLPEPAAPSQYFRPEKGQTDLFLIPACWLFDNLGELLQWNHFKTLIITQN